MFLRARDIDAGRRCVLKMVGRGSVTVREQSDLGSHLAVAFRGEMDGLSLSLSLSFGRPNPRRRRRRRIDAAKNPNKQRTALTW